MGNTEALPRDQLNITCPNCVRNRAWCRNAVYYARMYERIERCQAGDMVLALSFLCSFGIAAAFMAGRWWS